jgi:hypothetical protein
VEVLGGACERAVFCDRVEYLKSSICHGVDKDDLFWQLEHKPGRRWERREARRAPATQTREPSLNCPPQHGCADGLRRDASSLRQIITPHERS